MPASRSRYSEKGERKAGKRKAHGQTRCEIMGVVEATGGADGGWG